MLKMVNKEFRIFVAKQSVPKTKVWPYQHVVMLLASQPWRATNLREVREVFYERETA